MQLPQVKGAAMNTRGLIAGIRRRCLRIVANMAAVALLAQGTAAAQDTSLYLRPEPLPRVALLIGASSYSSLVPLKNIPRDVDAIYTALDALGFDDILVVSDPCLIDVYNALDALDQRVMQRAPDGGAIVWVFIAGHGAMAGHDQFVLPVEFRPESLNGAEAHEVAVSTAYIQERLEKLLAGAGVVVVDACRTTFGDSIAAAQQRRPAARSPSCNGAGTLVWRKLGSPAPVEAISYRRDVQRARVGIGYSTRPGAEAPEAANPNDPGAYINALSAALKAPYPMVPNVFSSAYDDVLDGAARDHYRARPDFRNVNLYPHYLRSPQNQIDLELEDWKNTIEVGEKSPQTVAQYVKIHSNGDFLRPALRWLKARPQPAQSPGLTPMDSAAHEELTFVINAARPVRVQRYPADGVRQLSEQRSLRNERIVIDREGWGRLDRATADRPRYVRVESLVANPAELPGFWAADDVLDVTACIDAQADLPALARCLSEQPRSQWFPAARQVVNVLAVEAESGTANEASDTPQQQLAFRRALTVQQALGKIGVGYAQSRIHVVPGSFAPARQGRLLVKLSQTRE